MIKLKIEAPSLADNGVWKRAHTEVMKLLEAGPENGGLDATKPYRIYITDTKLSRTPAQHRYYWGVILTTFGDASGYHPEELHDIFKRMYAGYTMKLWPGGRRRKVVNSTTQMNVKQMSEYMEKCIAFCAEQGIVIPGPDRLTDEQIVHLDSEGVLKAR